jgi:tripartite-type tricarboxylate transporter receptor subunit TctC
MSKLDAGARFALGTAMAALAMAAPSGAWAQSYPNKAIRLIVPFTPGGGTDILARTIGQKLQESFGQQVLVDNRPGAGGTTGAEMAAKSPADGYTILMVSASYAVNAALYPLPFDPLKDLAPVSQVATVPFVLTATPSLPAANIKELLALAKAKPGSITYASSGIGSSPHLAGELLKLMAGIDMLHVPYKGGGPAVTDQLGGRVQLLFNTILQALPYVKSGKLKALAVGSLQRSAAAPEIPTITESGVPGYDFSNWFGILAPGATPRNVSGTLQAEIVKHLNGADLRARLAGEGAEVVGSTPEEFGRVIRADIEKYQRIVKAANVKIE